MPGPFQLAVGYGLTSAVNLKFLSLLAANSFREFQIQNRTKNHKVASGPWIPKFAAKHDPSTGKTQKSDH